jgi:hypothetical protein
MRPLLRIISYAGVAAFLIGAGLAGAAIVAMEWIDGSSARGVPELLGAWLLVSALMAALIIVVSSVLVQRQTAIFDLRSAIGAAAIMGVLTSAFFLGVAALEAKVDRGAILFLIFGGSVLGFVFFLAAFALLPRVLPK